MNIAYVANVRLPTEKAHGLQIMEMCRAFARNGHRVRLIVPKRKNVHDASPWEFYGFRQEFEIEQLPIFDFITYDRVLGRTALWLNILQFWVRARFALRALRPDVVYARDPWFVGAARGARYVFEAHDFPKRVMPLHRRVWNRVSRIVAVTAGLKEALTTAGAHEEKIVVAHDGVDEATFAVRESREDARASLGLPDDALIAIYTGHLYPYKGADDLLEAAARLDRRVRIVFVGGRPNDLARLKDRAAVLKLPNVEFAGQVPHARIPTYLRAADVAVLPTRASDRHASEFLSPLKLFEYMAAGKAIVATDTPSVREVLSDASALFVPPSDPAALANALNALSAAPERVKTLERESLRLAAHHTWTRRAEDVLQGITETAPVLSRFRRYRAELLLAGLAFVLRALYVIFFPQRPLEGGDAWAYVGFADAILGRGPWPYEVNFVVSRFLPPMFPYALAAVRGVFGEALVWSRLFQAVTSAATVFLMAVMARRLVSARAGKIAGLVGALYVPMILESGVLYTETLYTFLLTLSVALLLRNFARPSVRAALWTGLAFAAAGLTRELGFYQACLFSVAAALFKRPRALAFLILLPTLAAMLALNIRNASLTQNPGAAKPFLTKGYEVTLADPTSQHLLLRYEMYPVGVWRFFRYPNRLGDLSEANISVKSVLRSGDARVIAEHGLGIFAKLLMVGMHWILLLLAAYGLWRGRMSTEGKLILVVTIAFAGGTILLGSIARIQGFDAYEPLARYRFPIEPLIVILAAAGLDRLTQKRS